MSCSTSTTWTSTSAGPASTWTPTTCPGSAASCGTAMAEPVLRALHDLDGGCVALPSGPAEPIDRLAAGLALTAADRDLLVLALLGHHHEGVAAILRGLHPRGEPWATAGLACLLAERGAVAPGQDAFAR